MGGSAGGVQSASRGDEKDDLAKNWLQVTIDLFAGAYGWSKETTLALYPEEVPLLRRRIEQRHEQESDMQLYQLVLAARVPMMKDRGESILRTLKHKYAAYDTGEGVTRESIKRDLAAGRAFLKRHKK